ncbi:MAG: hypothetical protein Q4B80_01870 [Aerococcaceae bacterium]|nr:hypothetical protein [Aerococcaceae bacterium]
MKRWIYRLFHLLERIRYLFVVFVIQVPVRIGFAYLGYQLYLVIKEQRQAEVLEQILKIQWTDIPIPILIWGGIVIGCQIIAQSNLFKIKLQYRIHLENRALLMISETNGLTVFQHFMQKEVR